MAASRGKAPVGSARWFLDERRQANELVEQEADEFNYSVRNELEWLNEHMAEIYAANRLNVTDIFKTPGKLRGKTPRTARKKSALPERAPLTDIFAPNSQPRPSPSKTTQFQKRVEQIQIAEDRPLTSPARGPQKQRYVAAGKENHDSGYHGSQVDDGDEHAPLHTSAPKQSVASQHSIVAVDSQLRAATEEQDSFVSAKEKLGSKTNSMDNLREGVQDTMPDDVTIHAPPQVETSTAIEHIQSPVHQPPGEVPAQTESTVHVNRDVPDPMELDDGRSTSEASSPQQPLLRKSSLTFASLPAREPLNGKQSIGNRVSRTSHLEQYKTSTYGRTSHLGRTTGGLSLGASNILIHDEDDQDDAENIRPTLSRIESETTKLHNKTSTQRLHDAISKLGQTKEPRPSKSIPNFAAQRGSTVTYPNLANAGEKTGPMDPPAVPLKDNVPTARVVQPDDEDEGDWIAPVKPAEKAIQQTAAPAQKLAKLAATNGMASEDPFALRLPQQRSPDRAVSPPRAFGHVKSISASAMPSPTKPAMAVESSHKKAISVSNPDVPLAQETTTPAGSPARKYMDAPLSASKSKLYSVLKSAKNLFASSAAASAQAKSEVLSPNRSRTNLPGAFEQPLISPDPEVQPTPALYPSIEPAPKETGKAPSPARKTRSSSEREKQEKRNEKEAEVKQRSASDLERAREKERQKAAVQMAHNKSEVEDEMPPPPPPKSMLPQTKPREPRRLMKPSKEALNKSTGPPKPLTVHLASQRTQHQPNTAALSASLHDSLAPPPPPKQQPQGVASKASSSTLHSQSSSNTLKSSTSSQTARPKALEAAARKKELEEKAAQRKLEQKREIEQRRAAKLEEERKAEQQRKDDEQRRVLEAKKAAQKKAEEARRLEQQRREASRPASRQANDLANSLQQERAQQAPSYHRPDVGGARPLSQMKLTQDGPRPFPVNQAKPAKRPLQPDHDEPAPSRPAPHRNPPSYQQLDAKRRKTNEDEENEEPRRSVMAPPIRHSNIRKEPNKPPFGYMSVPQQSAHSSTVFKTAVSTHHHQQHGQPVVKLPNGHPHQYANARIPFADAMNTAPSASSSIVANTQTYKTPLRPDGPSKPVPSAAKSSPHYPAGVDIALPDIATDSEDENSDNEFAAPSWVASPFLNEALSQQQLVDPESVFGPIAELKMEEIFKNKERHKKFRERTSSAHWTADRLTEEERRRDKEGRERLMREGGWSFNTLQE